MRPAIVQHSMAHDAALPQLGFALDTAVMGDVLHTALRDTQVLAPQTTFVGCTITHARYKPGLNCLLCYSVRVREGATERTLVVYGRLYQRGGSASRFAKAQQHADPVLAAAPVLHLPALEMVLWVFPNDRKLRGLAAVADHAFLCNHLLPEVIAAGWDTAWVGTPISSDVVHYVAEHTCTVRASLHLRNSHTGAEQTVDVYGKTYDTDDGAQAYQQMQTLWDSPARRAGHLRMARPLLYQPHRKVLWQAGLEGATLQTYAADLPYLQRNGREAGALIAALHQSQVTHVRSVALPDVVQLLVRAWTMLGGAEPRWDVACAPVVRRLIAQAGTFDVRPVATLHGDLHLKNIISTPQGLALIDLDNLAAGDPLQDLGSFIAALYARGALDGSAEHAVQPVIDALVDGYARAVPWTVDAHVLGWYVAVALLVERAARSISRLKGERAAMVDDLIDLADRVSRNQGGRA